ncbi:MAG TPA: hypothetical protein VEQ58_18780, partial [Polyangiaceae bacterium]|nr:hypothetical protein [Polyangiaceae bacterium]
VLRLQRALLLVVSTGATVLAAACGDEFVAVPRDTSTSGGSTTTAGSAADAGADAGSTQGGHAGQPATAGGAAGSGGRASAGDSGGAAGGEAGAGGRPVEAPPIPIAGLQLWLRADPASVTRHGAGLVSAWKDLSGHGRDAQQTAQNFQPLLVEGALSGKPALVFDGTDDFLRLPALELDFSQGVSIFVAMQQEETGNCEGYFEASTDSEENDLHFGDWEEAFNYEVLEETVHDGHYPVLLHEPRVSVVVQQADGWARIRSNGNGAGEAKISLPDQVLRTEVFIAKTLYASCSFFKGTIGEVLVYNRGLSETDELLQVEQYLQDEWGCCRE